MRGVLYKRYGSPMNLEVQDLEAPVAGPGEVLVRVRAASINALDYRRFEKPSAFGRLLDERLVPVVGAVLGADIAGTVEALGPSVERLQVGDAVFGVTAHLRGGFAELAPAREQQLARKPDNVSFSQAAAVPTAAVAALRSLRDRGRIRDGNRVLIHGASGGVGTFAVQLARALGAEVTAVCGPRGGDTARSLGAARVIDYTKEDFAALVGQFDLIVGVTGDRSILDYRRALAAGGTYVALGGSMRQIMQGLLWGPLLSLLGGRRLRSVGVATVTRADLEQLAELLAAGKIAPVIDRTISLAEVPEALRVLTEGHGRGKVVVEIDR